MAAMWMAFACAPSWWRHTGRMTAAALLRSHGQALEATLRDAYGLGGALTPLVGERDANFRLESDRGSVFVKVGADGAAAPTLALTAAVAERLELAAPHLPAPRVVRTRAGETTAAMPDGTGARPVLVTTWLPGEPAAERLPHDATLLREVGRTLAELDRALIGLEHAAAHRPLRWDLRQAAWIGEHLGAIPPATAPFVAAAHAEYVAWTRPRLDAVRRGLVHGDANDHNVLLGDDARGEPAITGLIDFGDACHTAIVAEPAIAAAYFAMSADEPLAAIDAVVAGFHEALPLDDAELELVVPLIRMRLAVSITNAALQSHQRPGDPYVTVSQRGAERLLRLLHGRPPATAAVRLHAATGRGLPTTIDRVHRFLRGEAGRCAPVLGCPHDLAAATVLDLSFESLLGGDDPTTFDAAVAGERIARVMQGHRIGIGRYLEPRPIYTGELFGGDDGNARRRTVHLGIDLFAAAGTAVHAPLAGTVHLATDCGGGLDYGGLVVLRHETPDGVAFGTLYGHLDPTSFAALRPGQPIAAGAAFARLGDARVNGGWPPHLHLQVLAADPVTLPDVPPGVADPDDLAAHEALHPDPSTLIGITDGGASWRAATAHIAATRRERFATNLRTSYHEPIHFVRGWRHVLFDALGRRHLDAYNNVPHVGHAHPHVAAAVARQTALLATNTRYLHAAMGRYAERLAALLPPELSVFFFTASGSEATELALRLARTHTGAIDLCVMDHGYHGHTTGAMAVSPYKLRQRSAPAWPEWLHVTPQPDVFRGPHRGADAATTCAAAVAERIVGLAARGRRLCGYLCESMPSVGGQVVLPDGFLPAVYRAVREAGGVCLADEVQTALWRTGDTAFAFQRYGVVPDVVVLGKPLGNGFPLGAVVTTPVIAASFADGPEWFSTFGGSTVAMAAGLATLEALEQDNLAANARHTGARLMAALRGLQSRHAIVGDVRGAGLFLGVELCSDADRSPATSAARHVKNRLREQRILIGTDGPDDNVLKIRPPMTFDSAAADLLVDRLDTILAEHAVGRTIRDTRL
jgi:4-aminobutyrate aminotransferase-like enzyme/Ser/Thr protein kinase RdoA (MazF antagonist)